MRRHFLILVAAGAAGWASLCIGQDAGKAGGKKADAPAATTFDPAKVTAADYPKLYSEWKELVAALGQLRLRYQSDASADKKALEAQFNDMLKKAQAMAEPLGAAGEKAYVADPNKDRELTEFLVETVRGFVQNDDYEKAARLAKLLTDNKCDHPETDFLAGIAFFNSNEFDAAAKYLQAAKDKKAINEHAEQLLEMTGKYQEMWNKEQELREKEEKAKNLPTVKLETTKGDIIVALFENEAPNTTANFISLVEKNFYDGLAFHRVLPGFMAQGGDPNGDGSGGPGYTIPDECRQENHRNHFRGSLSMAKTAAPDTGGSQFFLTFVPTPHLDGKHTVFGRVIEGWDVLAKLQRTQGGSAAGPGPDKIVKATVLSKRKHPYKPLTQPDKK